MRAFGFLASFSEEILAESSGALVLVSPALLVLVALVSLVSATAAMLTNAKNSAQKNVILWSFIFCLLFFGFGVCKVGALGFCCAFALALLLAFIRAL